MVGLGRFGVGVGIVGVMAVGLGHVPEAFADSFHLKNGQTVEATVINRTLNTLALQIGNVVKLTSLSQIERVTIPLADGTEVSGELLSWRDGEFEIRVADEPVRVADGRLLDDPLTAIAAEAESEPVSDRPVAMQGSPTIIMKNGTSLTGRILHATGSVATIQPKSGTALPVSRAQIEVVQFESAAGDVHSGQLVDWQDGVYQIQLDDRLLTAALPEDVSAPVATPTAVAADTPAPTPVDQANERDDLEVAEASQGEPKASAEVEQADAAALPATEPSSLNEGGVGGPANETAIAGLSEELADDAGDSVVDDRAADDDDGPHWIEALVEEADEGSDSVVFKFQLSRPAARPLVVLYAATEASAKAGEDFEAKSGVITFATGSAYAEVQVPLIDDDLGEGSETFNLFLSGDPKTIQFSERQIPATINDND